MDRLHMLVPLLERWTGPASIALYLTDAEAQDFVDHWEGSPSLTSRCNVGFHVMYKEGDFYPINTLRNLALEHAETDYVFLTDIDFLPSPHAVSILAASTRSLLVSHPLRLDPVFIDNCCFRLYSCLFAVYPLKPESEHNSFFWFLAL